MTVPYNDPSKVFHPGQVETTTASPPQAAPAAAVPPPQPPRPAPAAVETVPSPPAHPSTLAAAATSPSTAGAGLGSPTSSFAAGGGGSRVSSHSGRSASGAERGEIIPYISAFVLRQSGAYQAYVTVRWTTADGRSGITERLSHSIGFGHVGSRSLRDKGIPEGARVRLELDVLLGKHSAAKEEFIYDSRAITSAFYASRGTSLTIDKLSLVIADTEHDE